MEELKQELYKIVYEYSIQNKVADKDFVVDVLDLCINAFNLKEYVKVYEVNSKNNGDLYTGYDVTKKYLLYNLRSVINGTFEKLQEEKEIGVKSNRFLDCFKVNCNVVNTIIFEMTTASQYKSCIEDPDTLENNILCLTLDRNILAISGKPLPPSQILYFKLLDRQYTNNRAYNNASPTVRMSSIKGAEYERDIANLLNEDEKGNIETYTELKVLTEQIHGYKDFAPTTFVKAINEHTKSIVGLSHLDYSIDEIESMYNKMAEEYHLTLDERIWLGLPIPEEEKEKAYQKRLNLQNILLKRD